MGEGENALNEQMRGEYPAYERQCKDQIIYGKKSR